MTLEQVRSIFDQGQALGSIESISFEGGEPFLYYGALLEGVREATARGWKTEAITNAYWATSPEDALLWLRPLVEAGLGGLLLSEDAYHGSDEESLPSLPGNAAVAADQLNIGKGTIEIRDAASSVDAPSSAKGEAIKGGAVRFRGRAASQLAPGLPRRPWQELVSCPHEELVSPIRVHVDPLGYVHICQGLVMGNLFQTALTEMLGAYVPEDHPICGPLLLGGPAALARTHDLPHADGYVDECQMCYEMRNHLRERFRDHLAPAQMYGVPRQDASE
jgi:MoaA/NifB/PqqE/SkfB family radical SAM enzyme